MKTLEFSKDWGDYFRGFGLDSFEDFFEYSKGNIINANTKRNVLAFSLGDASQRKDFFMKRFFDPHIKDMLFTFRNFGYICSQGQCEWNDANKLLDNGIATYLPVCFGADTKWCFEKRSFFITEKITGQCFTDFVRENWQQLDGSSREKIISSLGKTIRKIHDAKIAMPDLYVWHVFISETLPGEYSFSFIDLHRMKINFNSKNQFTRDLGAFDFSMLEKYFNEGIREVFLRSYLNEDSSSYDFFNKKLKARSKLLAARRRRMDY